MKSPIKRNYFYNLINQTVNIVIPIILMPYLSRALKAEGIGIFSYTNALANFFSVFAAMGLSTYGQREIAYNQNNKYEKSKIFWEISIIRTITTITSVIVYLFFIIFLKENSIDLLCQIFIVIAVMFDIAWFYQGIEHFKIIAIRNCAIKISSFLITLLFVKDADDLIKYILINSISVLLGAITLWFDIIKNVNIIPIKQLNIKRHLRGAIEFFVPVIAVQIYSQTDKIMLGALLSGKSESGYYEQTRKIILVINSIVISLNGVLQPRISNLFAQKSNTEIRKIYEYNLHFLCSIIFPIIVGGYFISGQFISWYLGSEFSAVATLLNLSLPLLLLMGIGNFVGTQFLIPSGRQNIMSGIYIAAATINIILNLILIPKQGAIGAVEASIIAEALSCIGQYIIFYNSQYHIKMGSIAKKYIISSLFMGIVLFFYNYNFKTEGIVNVLFNVLLGGICYLIAIVLSKAKILSIIKRV